MKHPLKKLGIAQKLIMYIFFASIVPLMFLGIMSYSESKSVLQTEINQASEQQTMQKIQYLDVVMSEVENLITNITRIEEIKDVVSGENQTLSSFDRLATRARIGYILSGYTNLKGLVSIDIFANNGEHFYVGDTLDIDAINTKQRDAIHKYLSKRNESIVWMGIETNVNSKSRYKKNIALGKLINVSDEKTLTEKNVGYILISYSLDVFYEHFYEQQGDTTYLIVDQENRILYYPDKSKIGTKVSQEFLDNTLDAKGTVTTTLDNKTVNLCYSKVGERGWMVAAITPISAINEKVFNIGLNTFLLLILCLGVAGMFSVIISRKFVSPIRNITHHFKEINDNAFDFKTRVPVNSTDEIGELCRWFNVFTQVYEEKEATEKELIRSKEAAEAANVAKSQFLANMSHEIRTPINGIVGFLELLSMTSPTVEQKEFIREGKSASHVLMHVINDILDFSKIEAGKLEMESISFSLSTVVHDSISLLLKKAEEKKIELRYKIQEDVPDSLIGDPSRLRQILNNLVSNAVKFTGEGGVYVDVSASVEDHDMVRVRFDVKDTGIGIGEEEIAKLFQSFHQADTSTTRKYGGTGLGLAISKELVERMEGTIWVESQPSKGSTFSFDVLLQLGTQVLEKDENKIWLNDINVMLLMDESGYGTMIGEYLRKVGCNVYAEDDSEKVISTILLKSAKGTKIDLLFLDNDCQGVEGYSFAKALRTVPMLQGIKLVMLTDYFDPTEEGAGYYSLHLRRNASEEEFLKAAEEALHREEKGSDIRILLVEDNEINRKIVIMMLARRHYTCDIAINGEEALAALEKKEYDLVFMDCQMPILDGYECTKKIREWENGRRRTRIIAMTASAMEGDRKKCLEVGMDDYISKPLNFDEVYRKIEERKSDL